MGVNAGFGPGAPARQQHGGHAADRLERSAIAASADSPADG